MSEIIGDNFAIKLVVTQKRTQPPVLQSRRQKQHQVSGGTRAGVSSLGARKVRPQIDYMHCLAAVLLPITGSPCCRGVMGRCKAEALLEAKAAGTFLLGDSAQENHLFSVSFLCYSGSRRAQVEQWNRNLRSDVQDPCVFHSTAVTGLSEH